MTALLYTNKMQRSILGLHFSFAQSGFLFAKLLPKYCWLNIKLLEILYAHNTCRMGIFLPYEWKGLSCRQQSFPFKKPKTALRIVSLICYQ
jgi:hypothetical protein